MIEELMPPTYKENMADAGMESRLHVFVGPQAFQYMNKWNRAHESGRSIGWNWAGALFGVYWLAYRKMYLFSAAYMVSFLAIGYLIYNKNLLVFLALLFNLLVGLFGDKLYQGHAHRKLSASKERGLPSEYQDNWLRRKGSVRWINILFPTLVAFLFSFTLSSVNRLAPPSVNEASMVSAQEADISEEGSPIQTTDNFIADSYLDIRGHTVQNLINTYQDYGVLERSPQYPAFKQMESKDNAFSISLVGSDVNHVASGFINFFIESDQALTYTGLTLQALFINVDDFSDERDWEKAATWVAGRIDAFNMGDTSSQEIVINSTKLSMVILDNYFALLTFAPKD